jgi:hypothetical protein
VAFDRCRLLAGSYGPERLPARPNSDHADWYLPLHLRDPATARDRITAQIAAGADVVVAPTWQTHRRALLPLGETRRAATWTAAAMVTAREAIEIGLERRAEAMTDAEPDVPDLDLLHSGAAPRLRVEAEVFARVERRGKQDPCDAVFVCAFQPTSQGVLPERGGAHHVPNRQAGLRRFGHGDPRFVGRVLPFDQQKIRRSVSENRQSFGFLPIFIGLIWISIVAPIR